MALPTVAATQNSVPTTTTSTTTIHSPFTPSGLASAGFVIAMTVQWTTTARTYSSIATTSSNIAWQVAVPQYVPGAQANTMLFVGLALASGSSLTTTITTVSGTAGTATMVYDEFHVSGLPSAPSWTVRSEGANSSTGTTKSTPSLTPALLGKYGDFYYSTLWNLSANASSANNAQSWLTYDTTNIRVYGIVPIDQTVPASGFNLSATDNWSMPTMILNSGVVPEPSLWVPPGVNLNVA